MENGMNDGTDREGREGKEGSSNTLTTDTTTRYNTTITKPKHDRQQHSIEQHENKIIQRERPCAPAYSD